MTGFTTAKKLSHQTGWLCRSLSCLAATLLALFSGLLLQPASAQVTVKGGRILVSLQPLAGAKGAEATALLKTDLQRSGVVDLVDSDRAEWAISGTANGSDLAGILLNKSTGHQELDRAYNLPWRSSTHNFADDIIEILTGTKGIASTRIAFISKRTGAKELYVMDLDGENIVQVTTDRVICGAPNFSPLGHSIAYTSYKSGYPDVYVIDLNSGKREIVANYPGLNSGAAFSPKGDLLALTLSKSGNPEIYIIGARGGTPSQITHTRGTESSPSWSPDGNSVVYSSDDRGSPQLFITRLNGQGTERLTTGFLFSTEPCWSPDGKSIVFNARVASEFQVCVYDVGSKSARQLTTSGNNEDPNWCRDSRHVIYSAGGKLTLLDVVSGEKSSLENGLNDCLEPSCSP